MYRFLIVDDEVELCELLQEILEIRYDCEVTIAHNGYQASSLALNRKFDLIITDYKMPMMDGGKFIETLRSVDSPSKDTDLLLISGHIDDPTDGPEAMHEVMFLEKPINMEKFINYTNKVLANRYS